MDNPLLLFCLIPSKSEIKKKKIKKRKRKLFLESTLLPRVTMTLMKAKMRRIRSKCIKDQDGSWISEQKPEPPVSSKGWERKNGNTHARAHAKQLKGCCTRANVLVGVRVTGKGRDGAGGVGSWACDISENHQNIYFSRLTPYARMRTQNHAYISIGAYKTKSVFILGTDRITLIHTGMRVYTRLS